jgi:hypothetical protein
VKGLKKGRFSGLLAHKLFSQPLFSFLYSLLNSFRFLFFISLYKHKKPDFSFPLVSKATDFSPNACGAFLD